MKLAILAMEFVGAALKCESIHGEISEVDIELAGWSDNGQMDASTRGGDFGELIVESDVDEVVCRAPRVDKALYARGEGGGGEKYC
jgi:hypothetical protein